MFVKMNNLFVKISVFFEKKKKTLFNCNVKMQTDYLKKLGKPNDDIERSFFQYKCQKKLNGILLSAIYNIFSFPLIFIYIIKYYSKEASVSSKLCYDAVFFRDGKPSNILPSSLRKKFEKIQISPVENIKFANTDIKFIKMLIKKYPFSYYFILKCLIKIGKYRYAIDTYAPKAIIVCAEFSFTSSLLTAYCNMSDIFHINIMHGEKLFYMRDSFFHFDNCYVWDEYYKELFVSLGAEKNQFVVEVPESLKMVFDKKCDKLYDFTYYLGSETTSELERISSSLKLLCINGFSVSVRPHPRYSNLEYIYKMFDFANVEDSKTLSIEQSLANTNSVISLYSTVLNQALNSNIEIIIDDITNIDHYNKLFELKYICLKKHHKLLSDVLNDLNK